MHRICIERTLTGAILDVGGGGEGIIGRVYGGQVTAIDRLAEELAEAPDGPVKLVMDARALAFPDGCFDHATAFFSFMFMSGDDYGAVAHEVFRVLRPGGHFLIWDAAFLQANPFLIELAIDAAGQAVHTTYGIVRDEPQSAELLAAAMRQAGFSLECVSLDESVFFMDCKKPACG